MIKYDVIICGGGPAGITAAIYVARYKMKALMITDQLGGYLNEINVIENYPSETKISGLDLIKKMQTQIKQYKNITIKLEQIKEIKKGFRVRTDKAIHQGKSVILALGARHRKLGIPGEQEFLHKGVSYCAVCEAPLFRGKTVGVVGGSNAAVQTGLLLSKYAKTVYIIYRKDKLRGFPILVDQLKKKKNVKYVFNANVTEILGSKFIEKVKLDTGKELALDGLFIEIGLVPASAMAKDLGVKSDKAGRIKVNNWMGTNVKGVFCAGDLTDTPLNQIVVAEGQGSIAATSAYNFVRK